MKATNTWKIENVNPVKPNTDPTAVPATSSNAQLVKMTPPINCLTVIVLLVLGVRWLMVIIVGIVLLGVRPVMIRLNVSPVMMDTLKQVPIPALYVQPLALLVPDRLPTV